MGDARHIGEQGREQAAGAAFGRHQGEFALARFGKQPAHRFLQPIGQGG